MKNALHNKIVIVFLVMTFFVCKADAQDYSIDKSVRLLPDTSVADVAIADMNGDGKTDIIITNPVLRTLRVLVNNCSRGNIDSLSFTNALITKTLSQPSIQAIADVNKDGRPDVFVNGFTKNNDEKNVPALTLYVNAGKEDSMKLLPVLFSDTDGKRSAEFFLKPGDVSVKVSDVDSDGQPEILVLNKAGFISIYTIRYIESQQLTCFIYSPVLLTVAPHAVAFGTADFDGDGRPDILLTNNDSAAIYVLHNRIKKVILPSSFYCIHFHPGFQPLAFSLTHINSDNKKDAFIINAKDSSVVLMENTSMPGNLNAIFTSLPKLKILSNYNNELVVHDVNHIHAVNLFSLDDDIKNVHMYWNSRNYFNKKKKMALNTVPDCITDLDGDGTGDIITGSYFGLNIYHGKAAQSSLINQPVAAAYSYRKF